MSQDQPTKRNRKNREIGVSPRSEFSPSLNRSFFDLLRMRCIKLGSFDGSFSNKGKAELNPLHRYLF